MNAIKSLSVLAVLLVLASDFAQAQTEAPTSTSATGQTGVGYVTVREALETLRAKPGVKIQTTEPDRWTIVSEPGDIQWSFTPSGHYAHPAVVRRTIKVNSEGGVYIEMTALCQAEKVSCDKLVEEFKELNERIRQSVKSRLQK